MAKTFEIVELYTDLEVEELMNKLLNDPEVINTQVLMHVISSLSAPNKVYIYKVLITREE